MATKKSVATNAPLLQNNVMPYDPQDPRKLKQIRIRCQADWKEAIDHVAALQGKSVSYFMREAVTIISRRWCRANKFAIPEALFNPHINGESEE